MVTPACYPSPWEAEAGRSAVQGQPPIHSAFKATLGYVRHCLKKLKSCFVLYYFHFSSLVSTYTDVVILTKHYLNGPIGPHLQGQITMFINHHFTLFLFFSFIHYLNKTH